MNARVPGVSEILENTEDNLAPIIVIVLSAAVYLLCMFGISREEPLRENGSKTEVTTSINPAEPSATRISLPPKPDIHILDQPLHVQFVLFFVAFSMSGGFVVSLAACILYWTVPRWHDRLNRFFGQLAVRPFPAVYLIDFVAAFCVFFAAAPLLRLLFASTLRSGDKDQVLALRFVISDVCWLSGVVCAIFLARHRARSKSGSLNFWPFWDNSTVEPKRSVLREIGMGLLTYPLLLWIITASAYANNAFVKMLGSTPKQHDLIPELAKPHSPETLVVIFLAATVGAAYLEETFFRGVLYNACRKRMPMPYAAMVAAAIFAMLHMNPSQLLPLFILGLALTWLYDKTGRLIAGMALHFVNNGVTTFMALHKLVNQNQ